MIATNQSLADRFDPKALAALEGLDFKARYVMEGFLSGQHESPFHGFSVEFSELAPQQPAEPIDDATASRGAWIEFRTADLAGCQQRVREAGIPAFRHPGSSHAYFSAPGGQVFRILDVAYIGP